MAIEARNRTLPDWFTRIRTRQTVLPRFQRFEAWDHEKVSQLFNTILQDLPVGAVLVLGVGNEEPFKSRTLQGAPIDGERVTEHLLDGQQRLTALWRGLNNNYDDRTYFLNLTPDDETGMPYFVDSIARYRKEGEAFRRPPWANSATKIWDRKRVPLDLCSPDIAVLPQLRAWLNEAVPDPVERDKVSDQISIIRQTFSAFNLPFLSLPVNTKKQTALDVFIKMNTAGEPLTTFDIVVAQVEAGMGSSLHDVVKNTKTACPAISLYYPAEELVLYASALLQGRAPTNATYLAKDFGETLMEDWSRVLSGAKRTAAFLEEERIFEGARLPSDVIVPVLVALWADAPKSLDSEGRARSILRKYAWRAFFSDRYEKSTNSRSLADYNELKAYIADPAATLPAILDDKQYPLPSAESLIPSSWPKKKDRVARAILAVALRQGGLDLADGSTANRNSLATREYHHLFPVAHLQRLKVPEDRIGLSLNCALVTWQTNRNIADKEPEEYLAERLDDTGITEAEVRARLESHLIPYDEMVAGDYEVFLQKRAEKIHKAMTALCGATEASATAASA